MENEKVVSALTNIILQNGLEVLNDGAVLFDKFLLELSDCEQEKKLLMAVCFTEVPAIIKNGKPTVIGALQKAKEILKGSACEEHADTVVNWFFEAIYIKAKNKPTKNETVLAEPVKKELPDVEQTQNTQVAEQEPETITVEPAETHKAQEIVSMQTEEELEEQPLNLDDVNFIRYNRNYFDINNGYLIQYLGNEKTVIIPNAVNRIGKESFAGCESVETVILNPNITFIDNEAFIGCKNLTTLYMQQFAPDILNISGPDIGYNAFAGCNIKKVYFRGSLYNWLSLRFSGYLNTVAFSNPLHIGADLYLFNNKINKFEKAEHLVINQNVYIMSFYGCKSLKTIRFDKSVRYIESYAFYKCTNLETVIVPKTIKWIAGGAFAGLTSKTNIVLEKPSVKRVGMFNFKHVEGEKELIPVENKSWYGKNIFAFSTCNVLLKCGFSLKWKFFKFLSNKQLKLNLIKGNFNIYFKNQWKYDEYGNPVILTDEERKEVKNNPQEKQLTPQRTPVAPQPQLNNNTIANQNKGLTETIPQPAKPENVEEQNNEPAIVEQKNNELETVEQANSQSKKSLKKFWILWGIITFLSVTALNIGFSIDSPFIEIPLSIGGILLFTSIMMLIVHFVEKGKAKKHGTTKQEINDLPPSKLPIVNKTPSWLKYILAPVSYMGLCCVVAFLIMIIFYPDDFAYSGPAYLSVIALCVLIWLFFIGKAKSTKERKVLRIILIVCIVLAILSLIPLLISAFASDSY